MVMLTTRALMDHILKDSLYMLQNSQQAMISQLYAFGEINSGTSHLHGLKIMRAALTNAFSIIADEIHTIAFEPIETINMTGETELQMMGDALWIRKRPELKRRILLAGHMDTVFQETHPFQRIKRINERQLNGPGLTDMKGGLIVMLHALNAFEATTESKTMGIDIFINADEEVGSLASHHFYIKHAKHYQAALVYEPSLTPEGTFAKNRKGSGQYTLIVLGKAAHAGRDFTSGRNAICFLATYITQINALNNQRPGVTINIGKIAGGSALNVVPDKAVVKIDIRIENADDATWFDNQLKKINRALQHKDYHVKIHGHFGRPVKHITRSTERLFGKIQQYGKQLGLSLDWADAGGCCDGNNLSHLGLPVIDTLGVRGGAIHTTEEYILLDSMTERAMLSTLLLTHLARGTLETLTG